MALLAGMTIVACSNDDDKKSTTSGCVTCDAVTVQGMTIPEFELCREDYDTQAQYDQAIQGAEFTTDCN